MARAPKPEPVKALELSVEASPIPLPDDLEAAIRAVEDAAVALAAIAEEARRCGQVAAANLAASRAGKRFALDVADDARRRAALDGWQSQAVDLIDATKKAEAEQAAVTRALGTTRDEHKKVSAELEDLLSRLARVREQVT